MRLFLFVLLVVASSSLGFSAEIIVPTQQPNIKAAIAAANNGDIIQVMAGTYKENIDFSGKAIKIRAISGPYQTFIDGNQAGSVVSFISGEGAASFLEGFSIINGTGTNDPFTRGIVGGGVYCSNSSSPTLKNLIIESNVSDKGAGLFCSHGTLNLERVDVRNNTADTAGGGVFLYFSDGNFRDVNVVDNTAGFADGGGVYCYNTGSFFARESNFIGNQCPMWGGGIASVFGNEFTLVNTVIADNIAGATGGGLGLFFGGSLQMDNVTVYNNEATAGPGGGVYLNNIDPTPVQSVFVNTILYNNTASIGSTAAIEGVDMDVSYCNVEGGSASIHQYPGVGTLTYGAGNISVTPLFYNTAKRDYHLIPGSGGIDAGNNNAPNLPTHDMEDDLRVNNGVVDMGADEHYLPYMYFSGEIYDGGTYDLNWIGAGSTYPVFLYIGSGVIFPPIKLDMGDWYLNFPIKTITLFPLPPSGMFTYTFKSKKAGFPAGFALPMQGVVAMPSGTPGVFDPTLTPLEIFELR